MKLLKNKGLVVLSACILIAVVMMVQGLNMTLADANYAKNYSDPYTVYNRQIEVGETKSITTENAYSWNNSNNNVIQFNASTGNNTATLKGLIPGVSTVSATTSNGNLVTYNYKVVDLTNIKSYSLAGGAEGHIADRDDVLTIPISTDPAGSVGKIVWTSLNTSIATVSGGVVTATADSGAAIILGEFVDPWGLEHTIPFLIIVGDGNGGGPSTGIVTGPDGNKYRPVGRPPHVWEKLNPDESSKEPPEYIYSPDDTPGNEDDVPATLEDGKYYVEDPENIWTPVGDDGLLDENNMIWGGPDGLPSGLDNEPVDKIGDEYWVHVGQNVWRKYLKNSPKGPLGPLTGGGPDGDPTTDPVTEIYDNTDNDGRYYVGPLGPDEDNNMYYYGDPQTGGNGTLDSTANGLEKDDVKYYKDKNGNMTTTKPTKPLPENPEVTDQGRELVTSKTGDTANWLEIARYGDYSLIIRKDFINVLPNHKGEMTWQTLSFGKTNDYQKSRVRDAINDWFNGRSTGDNLVANARLRSFTVSNNAYSVLGTGSSDTGGLSNGFSKPTGNKIGDGNDITFLLSFTEAANFISTEYASSFTGGVYLASNASAVKNFGKLTAQEAGSGIWLRTPGTNDLSASSLQHVFGRVYQFLLESLQGLAYPALWVHQDIFE